MLLNLDHKHDLNFLLFISIKEHINPISCAVCSSIFLTIFSRSTKRSGTSNKKAERSIGNGKP